MHEASLVQGLLRIALGAAADYAMTHPGKACPKISEIICEAGLLACFEAETLKSCFEIFAEGTAAARARLTINTAPLPCKCQSCGNEFKLERRRFVCPACGGENIQFSGGNGLVLLAVNIDPEGEG